MEKRTSFPPVFWVANTIEVLERFAYYGIFMGFGIYMASLGYTRAQLGIVQSIFLTVSYAVPLISGTFADRYGFKKVLIVSYLAYLPSIIFLTLTKTFSGIALTMLSIGFAAGIFKPLISGTVRAVTDKTNKTLGFGVFYAMVNLGASFGPIVLGMLRSDSWDQAFMVAGAAIGVMFVITIFFYKEPPREMEGVTLSQKFQDLGTALSDIKFSTFLMLLGLFFWLPFWAFFNLAALYVDSSLDTAELYRVMSVVIPTGFMNLISEQEDGVRRILGETISHTGYVIIFLQVPVSWVVERYRAMPAFNFGLFVATIGFVIIGMASGAAWLIFPGIFFFAIGEMVASPRVQEYVTWLAPKEKAGLYMGANFLSIMVGALVSGISYTPLYGVFEKMGHPEYIWYVLAAHLVLGILVFMIFVKQVGEFTEREE